MNASLEPIRRHRRAFVVLNAVYFGLIVLGMLLILLNPSIQPQLFEVVQNAAGHGLLAIVANAYVKHQLFKAIALTFLINLLLGSVVQLHLPSMIVPFVGLLFAGIRALLWGLLFSPVNPPHRLALVPHYLTLLLEGEGYVLAMLAVYVQGRWLFGGSESRWSAYQRGTVEAWRIYKLVAMVLAIAAVYEALEVIYVVPLLK